MAAHVVIGPDRRSAGRPARQSPTGALGHLLDHVGRGQFELARAQGAADLALVGFVVAADQHGHRLAVGQIDQAS